MSLAARLGDNCSHGGVIIVGCPTVLIGNMPAARVGDMHVCPMVTPGTPPIPHVGGPIMPPGSPTVFIGGMPAARAGDMAVCTGPPDSIVIGCPTVMIGTSGSGSGSGGGAGSSGASSANASAKNALSDNVESTTKQEHWVEFEFKDKAGNTITGIPYKLTDTESKDSESVIKSDGRITRDALPEGEAKVILRNIFSPAWSKDTAKVGDKVKLTVKSMGLDDGEKVEFVIFVKDANYQDHILERLETTIKGDKAEIEWELKLDEKFINIIEYKENIGRYSQPYFYFEAYCSDLLCKSPLLYYEDYIELEFKDEEGNPLANKEYKIVLPTGEIKQGKLDGGGKVKLEKIPPGNIDISLIH